MQPLVLVPVGLGHTGAIETTKVLETGLLVQYIFLHSLTHVHRYTQLYTRQQNTPYKHSANPVSTRPTDGLHRFQCFCGSVCVSFASAPPSKRFTNKNTLLELLHCVPDMAHSLDSHWLSHEQTNIIEEAAKALHLFD